MVVKLKPNKKETLRVSFTLKMLDFILNEVFDTWRINREHPNIGEDVFLYRYFHATAKCQHIVKELLGQLSTENGRYVFVANVKNFIYREKFCDTSLDLHFIITDLNDTIIEIVNNGYAPVITAW